MNPIKVGWKHLAMLMAKLYNQRGKTPNLEPRG